MTINMKIAPRRYPQKIFALFADARQISYDIWGLTSIDSRAIFYIRELSNLFRTSQKIRKKKANYLKKNEKRSEMEWKKFSALIREKNANGANISDVFCGVEAC